MTFTKSSLEGAELEFRHQCIYYHYYKSQRDRHRERERVKRTSQSTSSIKEEKAHEPGEAICSTMSSLLLLFRLQTSITSFSFCAFRCSWRIQRQNHPQGATVIHNAISQWFAHRRVAHLRHQPLRKHFHWKASTSLLSKFPKTQWTARNGSFLYPSNRRNQVQWMLQSTTFLKAMKIIEKKRLLGLIAAELKSCWRRSQQQLRYLKSFRRIIDVIHLDRLPTTLSSVLAHLPCDEPQLHSACCRTCGYYIVNVFCFSSGT